MARDPRQYGGQARTLARNSVLDYKRNSKPYKENSEILGYLDLLLVIASK